MTPHFFYAVITAVLGFILAIPPNTCIVMVNLESIRKKVKLSPSDVIFMAKAMVNIIYQGFLSLRGMLSVLSPAVVSTPEVYLLTYITIQFSIYFSFWMTVWLSAHYCTTITNLQYGFCIWIKRIMSNFLNKVLSLTALVLFAVCVPYIWTVNVDTTKSSKNSSVSASDTSALYHVHLFYFVPVTFLGVILPFFLSLLCLLLTLSILVRHVWRVKNSNSGCSRPNLQAVIYALRTIFFLLLMFTSVFMSRIIFFIGKPTKNEDLIAMVTWTLLSFSPSFEAAIIFQASNKLRRIIVSRFWTKRMREAET